MGLLHLHSGNLYGGVETMMLTLVRESVGRSPLTHEFALAFDAQIGSELRAIGVPVHWLGDVRALNPISVIRARRRLAQLLRAERYRAVVCHTPWPQAISPELYGGLARR